MTRGTPSLLGRVTFVRDCSRDHHNVFPFWDLCFVSCKIIRRTNEQMNERTNVAIPFRFGAVTGPSRGSACRPLRCHVRKRATQNRVWFSTNQKLIPLIVMDAIAILWGARRSYNRRFASANALEPSRTTTNKEATPPGTYLIASGSDDPDFHGVSFCRAVIVSLAPALVRSCPEEVSNAWQRSLDCNGFCL